MLSDEEKKAIEYFKNEIKGFETVITAMEKEIDGKNWLRKNVSEIKEDISMREIALNLIEKQQKEIEELKEQNLIQRKQLNDAFDRGWIHKNTIEAGIKEFKNKKGDPLIRGAKIRALQSLLKKGNDADVR